MSRVGIDVGDATLESVVAGTGDITVVFESGLATALEVWDAVAPQVAERTRTLRYDRRAAPPTGPVTARTAMDMVVDLQQLLRALSIGPPYVLVGHSWGGVVARVFAQRNPSTVAGLVFADATHESLDSPGLALMPLMHLVMGVLAKTRVGRRWLLDQVCPAQAPASYRALVEQTLNDPRRWQQSLRRARMEGGGIRPSLEYLKRHCPELPLVPARVLTAGGVTGPNVKTIRRVHDAWRAMVARSPLAEYRNVPNAGHQLPVDAPQDVVDAILAVLAVARTSATRSG
jgi:pimeloyl-ACP methyl ester carboxylesterase